MNLEAQIETLAKLGLPLNEGLTASDLLKSYSREEYQDPPFDAILFAYGIEIEEEPWGRFFCDRVWSFDAECIYGDSDYTTIVEAFHRISGKRKSLEALSDEIDVDSGHARLRYTIDGQQRNFRPRINNDWVDPNVAAAIMHDFGGEGRDFYGMDDGQATLWFYMTAQNADALNSLAGNVLRIHDKPWWKFW